MRSSERTFLFPMFKEYFKKTCLIIFAAIPLSFIFFCILQHFLVITTYETRIEQRVYVTDTGKHYHSYECGYLRSKNAIGRTKAVEEGYTPCAVCLGFPNGEIEVVYEKTKCNTPLTLTLSILAGLLFSITVFWIIDNKKIPSDDD